eukprot:scaffold1973_cov399-Prasinococcus_capsulatus_cf.AAC.31
MKLTYSRTSFSNSDRARAALFRNAALSGMSSRCYSCHMLAAHAAAEQLVRIALEGCTPHAGHSGTFFLRFVSVTLCCMHRK